MRFLFWRFSPLAFLFAFTLSTLFTHMAPANPQEKRWSVESVPETKFVGKKAKIDLRVSRQMVVAKASKLAATEIPVASIASVSYDETAHSKGRGLWNASNNSFLQDNNEGLDPFGFIAPSLDVGAALAAPFKTREHFIRILWWIDSEPQEIVFQASKGDYKDILAGLQAVTGKPWHDLPSQRQKLREELDRAKDRKIALQTDHAVLVSGIELKPGPYQLVLLERGESQGEAYFFSGSQVRFDHVAAQAVALVEHPSVAPDVGPKSSGSVQPEMIFGSPTSQNTPTDLRLPDKTLHFTSLGVPEIWGSGARIFSAGGNRRAVVRRTTHNGEPALSFPVLHSAFRPCKEILFVTRTSVALEPVSPSDSQCAVLSASRGEVKAEAPAGIWNAGYLQFKWKEKPYRFQPLFESPNGGKELPGIGHEWRAAAHEFGEFFVRAVEDFDAVERETQPPAALP